MTFGKVGLVLSGGGAKGAYQAGVLRALAEAGIKVDVVAGASIGALNGAMVASASDMETAAERLHKVWSLLSRKSPLHPHWPSYLRLLVSVGQAWSATALLERFLAAAVMETLASKLTSSEIGLFSDEPLRELLDQFLDPADLARGRPLHVSIYRSRGILLDLAADVLAIAGLRDTPDSEFKHVQSLPLADQKECLLASAALPLVFKRREVHGDFYSDGGQGGWHTVQGNTPITPLLREQCDLILVSHLGNGSLWSRPQDADGPAIVELRPRSPISRKGATDLLGFEPERISSWIEQGHADTMVTLAEVADALHKHHARRDAQQRADSAVAALDEQMSALANSRFARSRRNPVGGV